MYIIIDLILLFVCYQLAKKYFVFQKILMAIVLISLVIYLGVRITLIPVDYGWMSFVVGVLLYMAEVIGLISFLDFMLLFTKRYELQRKGLGNYVLPERIPSVDILICTYNESLELLEKTIIGCKNLKYPKSKFQIYVCDDGKRENLKKMCEEYGVTYITREDNYGAKAGNINNALNYISGELFAVLDADMIPKKNFLYHTVGYFTEETIAFVQVPQVYYNQDMYQYNLNKTIPNEQDFFMWDIEKARAALNALLHVGTNAVFRRKCIDEIGGYPTNTITEDMAVGMLLQQKGYSATFVEETLVLGLSAATFTELVKQRDRWCRGNLQVLKEFNPFGTKGLNLKQKIIYMDGAIYWLSSLQKMIYMICPILYLLFGIIFIDVDFISLLLIFLPLIFGQIAVFKCLVGDTRSLMWSHIYEVAMAPHLSLAVMKEFFRLSIKFNVTDKDYESEKAYFQWNVVLPHILLLVLTVLAWIIGWNRYQETTALSEAFWINIVWSIYNLLGLIVAIVVAYQKAIPADHTKAMVDKRLKIQLKKGKEEVQGYVLYLTDYSVCIKLEEGKLSDGDAVSFSCNEFDGIGCVQIKEAGKIEILFGELTKEQRYRMISSFIEYLEPHYKVKRTRKK